MTTAKRCSCCRRTKPVAAYHRNRSEPDGLMRWCRSCVGACQAARSETPEFAAWQFAYNRRPELAARRRAAHGSEAYRRSQAAYRATPRARLLNGRRQAVYRLGRATAEASRARIAATVAAYDREIGRRGWLWSGN